MKHISPFKFLDSYQKDDLDLFFGREKETERLYDALSGVKLLLVYGPSGAGKTSLIECGLRNQFSDADWLAITVRRDGDMNASVFARIRQQLHEPFNIDPNTQLPAESGFEFGHAVDWLFAEQYKPVYLLFDQFEELLISGSDDEKKDYFTRLNQLIRYKVPCRVMLIMREEFIGHLSEFETLCPSIFQHRFRVEKMRKENVKKVIRYTLDAPHFKPFFRVDDSDQLADSILSRLPDKSREIELAHVQVFMSELWDRATQSTTDPGLPLLHESLILADDNLAGVLESFLKKQLDELGKTYGDKVPLETLAAMISERYTKLQISEDDLQKDLKTKAVKPKNPLSGLLHDLEKRRILRIVKSGEQTQYEISHDVLALVVGQNLTEEMQLRAKASDIYRVYKERKGHFSQEDLDLIRPYRQYKAYPPALKQRIKESEDHLHAETLRIQREKDEQLAAAQRQAEQERTLRKNAEVNEQRARQRTQLATALSGLALVLALMAGYLAYQSNKQQQALQKAKTEIEQKSRETQRALDKALAEERQRKQTEINAFLAKANQMLVLGSKETAIENLEMALKVDSTREDIRKRMNALKSGR